MTVPPFARLPLSFDVAPLIGEVSTIADTSWGKIVRVRLEWHYVKPPRVPSASGRVDAGAFRAGIHHALDPRVIPAAFGGFRCAPV